MGWQAETGVPGSMVGGGALIAPNRSGQATSYIYNRRPTAKYLEALYVGLPGGRAPSRAQVRADLAYWHPAAIVAVTTANTRLARYLTAEFGPPTIKVGDMLAWQHPVLQASRGRLAPLRREETHVWPGHDRHHRRSWLPWLAPLRTAAGRRLLGDMPG
jgi:hypothetical protein